MTEKKRNYVTRVINETSEISSHRRIDYSVIVDSEQIATAYDIVVVVDKNVTRDFETKKKANLFLSARISFLEHQQLSDE